MNKKLCIIVNSMLLVWFFLDMFGFQIGNLIFVEAAWNSIDGIWFLIFVGLFTLFCIKDKIGKYLLSAFLFIWLITQYLSHWHYTIFGATEEQIAKYNRFFANTFFIFPASDSRIIPDFYHIVLHIFILFSLFCMIFYSIEDRKTRTT